MRKTIRQRYHLIERLESRQLLAADLVGYWKADDLKETINDGDEILSWTDSVGGLSANSFGSPKFVATGLGGRGAVQFTPEDGADYFRLSSSHSPIRAANDFSLAVVFATSSTDFEGNQDDWFRNTAIVDSSSLGLAIDWGVSINENGNVAAGIGSGFGKQPKNVYSDHSVNDNQLHLAVVSRSGSTLALQIDDQPAIIRDDVSTSPLASLDVSFGAQKLGGLAFEGSIAEIRMFHGALDADQSSQLFTEVSAFYNNQPPQANDDEYFLDEDPILFFTTAADGVLANDTDSESDRLTAQVIDGPSHGRLTFKDDGSFFYDPENNFFGVDTFTYSAVDFRESAPATVTLNVRPAYDRPFLITDTYKAVPGELLSIPQGLGVTQNDLNPDQANLVVSLDQDVANGELQLNADGSFTYLSNGFSGETTFKYRVHDGTNLSPPVNVTLVVNTPPTANTDDVTLDEDQSFINLSDAILANDLDVDGNPISFEIVDQPVNGVLETENGLTFVPHPDFFGTDSFTYRINDGVDLSELATVNLTINPINDLPVTEPDSYVALPGEPIVRNAERGVLSNDHDIDSPIVTAILVDQPAHGQLQFSADGGFSYTADPDFLGQDSFSYRASDSLGQSEVTQVDLVITNTPITISEFVATNGSLLETRVRFSPTDDFYREELTPDWIELKNANDAVIDISGMHLTDDPDLPMKWTFPEGTKIPGRGYLVVYASGYDLRDPRLDREGRLHTNFNLNANGEYLALMLQDGTAIHEYETYPDQRPDISYGEMDGVRQFFTPSTPNAENNTGIQDEVRDTNFSINRGFYTDPISVDITTSTLGATIVYTTDGSNPTLNNGTVVAPANDDAESIASVEISETTTLRTAAFKEGLLPSNIDTNSYFYVADLVQQRFSNAVRNNAEWNDQLDESLVSLPAISLVSPEFNPSRVSPERYTSVEMIFPNGEESGFQVEAGVEHFGGHSINSPKKNMRLSFKSRYGDGSLNYDLFGDGAVSEFEQILLRTGSHDTFFWTHPSGGKGNHVRGRWAFDRQLEMGQIAPEGRFVQVFINGKYHGMHHLMERPNSDFMASYEGGYSFQYDALNAGTPIDGTADAWRKVDDRGVIDNYEELGKYLDFENYADYMLLQFFVGNDWDWNHQQNWAAARKQEEGAGFKFFAWDSDVILRSTARANVINRGGPGNLWNIRGGVKQHEEFVMLLADRAQNYFFNGGMFTDERLRADVEALADEIRLPIIAETGRWGGNAYTPRVWQGAIDWMLDRYAPAGPESRALTTIEQMRRARVFPSIDAPDFLVNAFPMHGGDVHSGDEITLHANDGTIYYSLDGSDPRLEGGALNPNAIEYSGEKIQLDESTLFKARAKTDDEWSALSETRFRIDIVPADASNLRITEINYHPGDLTQTEMDAGIGDPDSFEFIEFLNISEATIDLSEVHLRKIDVDGDQQGVEFSFGHGDITELAAGERIVVVEDSAAFRVRYGDGISIAGQWNGGLSNAGEAISLVAGDSVIHEFAYFDNWYPPTDGRGFTLQIVDPATPPEDWGIRTNWRVSGQVGGTPGTDDTVSIPGDANRDGVFNSKDLILIFQVGEYEDGIPGNSTWEEGDWNGDGDFTTGDLVAAFQAGHYSQEANPIVTPDINLFAKSGGRQPQNRVDPIIPAEEQGGVARQLEIQITEQIFAKLAADQAEGLDSDDFGAGGVRLGFGSA